MEKKKFSYWFINEKSDSKDDERIAKFDGKTVDYYVKALNARTNFSRFERTRSDKNKRSPRKTLLNILLIRHWLDKIKIKRKIR